MAQSKKNCCILTLLCLCPVGFLSLAETANRTETEQHQDAAFFFSIKPILFLYYEESLVSLNLNSKLLRFHCAHPNRYTIEGAIIVRPKQLFWFWSDTKTETQIVRYFRTIP